MVLLFALGLFAYAYFLFHSFPFIKTSEERAFITLKEAKIPYKDIVELFANRSLDQEKIKTYLALKDEDVYRLLAQNPSLSQPDFRFLWETSFSCKYGREIRMSLIVYQKLELCEVERILNGDFDYDLWSSLAQNNFLSEEQFDKLLSLTPKNFKKSMTTFRNISSSREKGRE